MDSIVVQITPQGLITAASCIAAVVAIAGYLFKARDWVKNQNGQDKRLTDLAAHHEEDMKESREERQLMIYGLLACLKGLKEQGCNGPVTEAINKIEKHLNQKAHE